MKIRFHGRGGQGCFTAARLLGLAATAQGFYSLAFPSFGPERRGAPVVGYTKISDKPVRDRSAILKPDVVVVLDEKMLNAASKSGLAENGLLLVNSKEITELALKILGRAVVNTAMLGLLAKKDIVKLEFVEQAIKNEFKGALLEKNLELLRRAYGN
ncbi:pyruvate/ketoisovalerate ferredoxin oxidoreductase subunit gamma [Fibrobacterales bacterium]|nr:pyruvate/ketoisovalerate ferredoxin oxidoreductase subunit gamma [Fibrobacterales bacterium]